MFPIIKKTVSALFISTLLTSAPAFADIIISGTRIIYNADKKDVNVRLENKGNRPLLIQNWLDTGDDNAVLLLVDHQVGLLSGVRDTTVGELKHNVVALANAARALGVPVIVTATMPDSSGPGR